MVLPLSRFLGRQLEQNYSSKPPYPALEERNVACRPLRRDLPGGAPHVDDARGRHATPPVENLVLVEPYPHPRPDRRRLLLVAALQNLLGLRVPVLYRDHL